METDTLTNLQAVLEECADYARRAYVDDLTRGGKPASGDLCNSVTGHVRVNGRHYQVTLTLLDYWRYVEGGAQGSITSPPGAVFPAHWPPVDAIRQWIDVKPVIPRSNDISPDSLAYLIGRKIARTGIEPYPAMARTVKDVAEAYRERIAEAFAKDVKGWLRKEIRFGEGDATVKAYKTTL